MLDGTNQGINRIVLSEDDALEVIAKTAQRLLVGRGHCLWWYAGHFRDHLLNILNANGFASPRCRHQACTGTGFINNINGFIWQLSISDIAVSQLRRRSKCWQRVSHLVMALELCLESSKDGDGFIDTRFSDLNFLKTPRKRSVFLKNPTILLVSSRPNTLDVARRQHRFQQVRRIHGTT